MSLQGTFDVVALADLLRMLAAGRKSGELVMEAGGAAGRIDFYDGECSGAESTDRRGIAIDETELHRRALDVCFTVARNPGGSFRFAPNEDGDGRHDVVIAVEPLLAELELLNAEWNEICEVIPSTDLRPAFVTQLSGAEITISANEWSLLARIDGYSSVSDLVDAQRESLVGVCRCIAELVRRGALDLKEPSTLSAREEHDVSDAGPSAQHDDVAYFGPRVVPVAPYGPGVDALTEVVVAAEHASNASGAADMPVVAVAGEDPESQMMTSATLEGTAVDSAQSTDETIETSDPRDRGAILRLFSGLREA